MDKHIILNGLGINFKTSAGKIIADKLSMDFLESDSQIAAIMAKLYGSYWIDKLPRSFLRLYTIMQLNYPTVIDRSMIDQLIFSQLQSEGVIDYWLNDTWKCDCINKDTTINAENLLVGDHFLIVNKNKKVLDKIISSKEFQLSARSDFYNTVDEYLDLQDRFIEKYSNTIKEFIKIEVLTTTDNISEIIDDLVNKILINYE